MFKLHSKVAAIHSSFTGIFLGTWTAIGETKPRAVVSGPNGLELGYFMSELVQLQEEKPACIVREPEYMGSGIFVHQQFTKEELVIGDTFWDADFGPMLWNGKEWIQEEDPASIADRQDGPMGVERT